MVVRDRLLRDIFGASQGAGQAGRADAFDEYRDLAMLADAWERGSLAVEVAEEAPGPRELPQGAPPGAEEGSS